MNYSRFYILIVITITSLLLAGCYVRPRPAVPVLKAKDFSKMSDAEVAREIECLEYILTQHDRDQTRFMTDEDLRQYLTNFWNNINPAKPSEGSKVRKAYLKRVNTANMLFETVDREGWRTDRGRIYCLYGEPSDSYTQYGGTTAETMNKPVDSSGLVHTQHTSGLQNKSMEAWWYSSVEGGVGFIFVDKGGVGDMALVHSNKDGEVFDDYWSISLSATGPPWLEKVFTR